MKSKMEVTSEEIKIIFLPENEFEFDIIEKLSKGKYSISTYMNHDKDGGFVSETHSIEITARKNKSNNEKHN